MQRPQFPLFTSHIDLAHQYWKNLLLPGDHAIDATCGNGHDSIFLAKILLDSGKLKAFDKQSSAIEAKKKHIIKSFNKVKIKKIKFKLFIYNLVIK